MKIEEEFYSKLKRIASVKRKKLAEKHTRGLGAKETFTLPAKLSKYVSGEKTRRCNNNLKQ